MSRFLNALRVNNIVHKSWIEFFRKKEVIRELKYIEDKLLGNYTPCDSKILRFATVNLDDVKVIVIGQEPYPQRGVATGRSFEIGNVMKWDDIKGNNSMNNILKLIYKSKFEKVKDIEEIRQDIDSNIFKIKNPDEIFDYWEEQGVLWLNSAFTCEICKERSHLREWEKFFEMLIEYICLKKHNIIFFLWGNAKNYKTQVDINGNRIYTASHPVSTNAQDKFIDSKCFSETMDIIKWVE